MKRGLFGTHKALKPQQMLIRYVLAISLIFGTVTISHFSSSLVLASQDQMANTINMSGRQRMLSQRIQHRNLTYAQSNFSNLAHTKLLEAAVTEFTTAHEILRNRAMQTATPEDALYKLYFGKADLDGRSREFAVLGKAVLKAEEKTAAVEALEKFNSEKLLFDLNRAVKQFEKMSKAGIQRAQNLADFSYMIAVAVLLFEIVVIFIPMFLQTKNYIKDINARNKAINAAHAASQKAERSAKAANAAKTKFLANMSHELRTPIHGIVGLVGELRERKLPKYAQESLDIVAKSAAGLERIIADLLDIGKIESDGIQLADQKFDLKAVIEEVSAGYLFDIYAKNLRFTKTFDPKLSKFYRGDRVRIGQLLGHLLDNAVKFTETGDISVEVKSCSDDVVIAVQDSGVGFKPAEAEAAFLAFEKRGAINRTHHSGVGLGLALSKEIATAFGGDIAIKRPASGGARIEVTLPLKPDADDKREHVSTSPTKHLNGSILIVDDNKTNRLVLRKFLSKTGLEISECVNGQEAVDQVKEHKFDLILMDLSMPVMDGLTAAKLILEYQKQSGQNQTPIIAVTANAFETDRRACKEVGMVDFVAKPVKKNHLIEILQKYLERVVCMNQSA